MSLDVQTELQRLLAIMAALRRPETGCPWDLAQDFASIAPYTIEEAYEVADAIAAGDGPALQDELGDLLFQVVYHARLAEEAGLFGFADVACAIADKMVRRHPHVFTAATGHESASDGSTGWEALKQQERLAGASLGALSGVASQLPALTRAAKLTARAGAVGFDWPDPAAVLDKLEEEIGELRRELAQGDPVRLQDELGDVLFVLANLARKLKLDPEICLQQANRKFIRRFAFVEQAVAREGKTPRDCGLEEMEAAWQAAKQAERDC